MNIIWLIFMHFIGDFAFQTNWMAENKAKYWYVMLVHCMVWTACISMALQYLGIFHLWKAIFLVLGHWVMDKVKVSIPSPKWWLIYPDQFWHFWQLIIAYRF